MAAYIQDRLGPNRVGPWGLLQPLADGAKFILKEEIIPAGADKVLFLIAPVLILATAMVTFATIPFGNLMPWKDGQTITLTAAPGMDIGLLFVFAIGSLGVYGVVLGGWASNNKYSFLGGLRSSAQLVSYEIPLGLSVIGVLLFSGSLNMETIINKQAQTGWWWFAVQPLAFVVFLGMLRMLSPTIVGNGVREAVYDDAGRFRQPARARIRHKSMPRTKPLSRFMACPLAVIFLNYMPYRRRTQAPAPEMCGKSRHAPGKKA